MTTPNIARYTTEELKRKAARGESRTDVARIEAMSDKEAERNAAADMAAEGVAADWHKDAVPARGGPKVLTSMRMDPDLLEYYKGTGPGWQPRINAILRAYMNATKAKQG